MAARQVFDTMDKDGEGIIDKSVCDNAMSATKAKFDAKESGTVTLADGRVVPASSVPPGTKLQGGATMPEAAKDGTVKMPDGKTVKPAPKVKVGGPQGQVQDADRLRGQVQGRRAHGDVG